MRLVCPNCDAEYEVDASVIPDSGRDVQCSNCGHAWFQLPPEVEAELAAEEALYDVPAPAAAPAPERVRTASRAPAAPDSPLPAAEPEPDEADAAAPAPPLSEPGRRSIDESILAVLREEAEREAEARRAEAPAVETQAELGLQPSPRGAEPVSSTRKIARLKGEPDPLTAQDRREMLPEVEELSSSLRSSSERRETGHDAIAETRPGKAPGRSGFRSGFTLVLLIAMLGAAAYVMAPKLSEQFPAVAPVMKSYVALVDQARVGLNGLVQSAIAYLQGLINKSG